MKTITTLTRKNYYIIACLLLGFVCVFHFFSQSEYYPYTYSKDLARQTNPDEIFNAQKTDTIDRKELLMFLFEKRAAHYEGTLKTLGTSIDRLAFLVMVSIMLLYFQPSDIELFGIKIPNLAIYLIVPVCILYYWLLFGFSLFNALASRESLFHLSRKIENSYFQDGNDSVYLIHSSRSSLEDVGIIDAWSNVFLGFYDTDYQTSFEKRQDNKIRINTSNTAVAVGLFVIFGGLQALAMGSALSMVHYYRKYMAKRNKKVAAAFEIILFSYFFLSHVTFFIAMHYSTLYLGSIWFLAAIFFYITLRALDRQQAKPVLTSEVQQVPLSAIKIPEELS